MTKLVRHSKTLQWIGSLSRLSSVGSSEIKRGESVYMYEGLGLQKPKKWDTTTIFLVYKSFLEASSHAKSPCEPHDSLHMRPPSDPMHIRRAYPLAGTESFCK